MFDRYRNALMPPYNKKDLLPVLITLFIVLLIPLTVITLNEQTLDRTRASASWVLVGTHPQASLQPSTNGKRITALTAWNGKLYPGFGDSGANTGPIAIAPYNPTTNSFENTLTANTHQISLFRIIGDKLYAPAHQTCCSGGATYTEGEPWQNRNVVNLVHTMDVATFINNDRWVAGQTNTAALLFRSIDGGQTWTQATQYNVTGNYYRYSFIGVYNGKLYVQASVAATAGNLHYPASRSQMFDGTQWTTGPNLLPTGGTGWKPVNFAGKMVYLSSPQFYVDKKYLISFDGSSARQVLTPEVYDFTIENNELYILRTDGRIQKTTDLVNWTDIMANSPLNFYSIGVLNGKVYIGTKDATIYSLDNSSTPTGIPSPTTPLVSPTTPIDPSPTTIIPTAIPTNTLPTDIPPTAGPIDNTNPTISITSPLNGASVKVKTNVSVVANATDNVAIDRVVFTVGGNTSTDYSAPYSYNWSVPGASNKSYTISARAYDTSGNSAVSQVTVRSIR